VSYPGGRPRGQNHPPDYGDKPPPCRQFQVKPGSQIRVESAVRIIGRQTPCRWQKDSQFPAGHTGPRAANTDKQKSLLAAEKISFAEAEGK